MDLSRLDEFIAKGRELLLAEDGRAAHSEYELWDIKVAEWLEDIAPNSGLSAKWGALRRSRLDLESRDWPRSHLIAEFRDIIRERMGFLANLPKSDINTSNRNRTLNRSKVFLVHGHDITTRETAARLLTEQGLEVVVLSEQASKGRTIIEKIEHNADAAFAVVLLTADDFGRAKGDKELKLRARQNVVFELGYFIGVLGRHRVCCLYADGVEVPSDYHGVVYVPLDPGGAWKFALLQELREADVPVDLNRIGRPNKPAV
jgi:predicted nucleotide-binding protein